MSPGRQEMVRVLSAAVVSITRPAGFRKSGQMFHRRLGECVQLIGFRMAGPGDPSGHCRFGGDIGLAFDSMCVHAGLPVLEKPKEFQCDHRGTRGEMDEFIKSAPGLWAVQSGRDPSSIVKSVARCVAAVIQAMDAIDSISAFVAHPWFGWRVPGEWRPVALYLLRDLDGAAREVKALTSYFHDRGVLSDADWWIDRLKLRRLKPRFARKSKARRSRK